ncbi:response regulator [Maridesulfovibrio frigidus]|uniref:response regulator n=1 Tax=Maridesulfovibrio frigidus TaxID=340956 RepID=UPI0004E18D29|nr:response regulator [Maridesulfovibrio frigidus]
MPLSKRNILIVDEEKSQLETLKKMLHPMHDKWTIHPAESSEEALELLEIQPFDIVIADFNINGFPDGTLLTEIKKSQPGAIRFIYSNRKDADNSMEYAMLAHQFISKPCSSDELISAIKRSLTLKNIFLNEKVSKAITSIDELPSMPDLYIKLEKELKSEEASIHKIGKLISEDLGMTVGILKLVNSSFFGLYANISSPEKAVSLLGIDTIKGLVLGMHLFESNKNSSIDFSIDELGKHCQYTGLIARMIAKAEGGDNDISENAFLAGFLHDIGKLILASSFPCEYTEILNNVRSENIPIKDVEKEIFGFTHAEVGAYLLALWGFDESVVEAVYCHHDLSQSKEKGFTPAVAVHVANTFEHELHLRNEEYAPHVLNADWLEQNGFSEKLIHWLELCAEQVEESNGS